MKRQGFRETHQPVVPAPGAQPHANAPVKQHVLPPPAPPPKVDVRQHNEVKEQHVAAPQSPMLLPRSDSSGGMSGTAVSRQGDGSLSDDSDSDIDDDVKEVLRKLDEDYEKKKEIQKKVFDTRMDKIQRSQDEKESLHQKTLEKHQKERAEYEKRRAEEEKKQNERLEKLQREWDLKRETIAQHKRKHKNGVVSQGAATTDQGHDSQATEITHARTLSSTSSNPSVSPAVALHKIPHDPGGPSADGER